ncbi:hypothetical protein VU04_10390, partial [Desulfobulbus sp. TB]|nr:hypothetical protein [Desulfobulbus sp. TB]
SAASAANKQDAKTPSLPTLHALVNGNPVQIRGERHIRPDNSSVTRLRLQLDDVDPQQIAAWLPNMGNSLRITTEKITASLELILPDSSPAHLQGKEVKEEISLSGKVSFTGLNITSLKTSSFQCKAPSAELVIQANPLRKQYQVKELILNSPQFSFTESKSTGSPFSSLPFSHWPGQLLTPASLPIDLIIHHLTINQGTLHREHEQPWENLQLELTGYRNQKLLRGTQQKTNRATALSFSAQQGLHKVQFQGTTTPDLDLIGKISLHNLDARLLNPYLETVGAGQTVQLKDGTAQLVMQINPVQKQYTITELILDNPELFELKNFKAIKAIKSSSPRSLPFSLPLDQLFNPVFLPFDLIIDQLTINQGTLQREQAQPWKNLQLKLTDYRNRELLRSTKKHTSNKAKALSFSAQQGARKVAFQGTTTPALDLIGKISLHNWNARFLNPYLKTVGADQTVQLKDGTAQLVMQVNPLKKQYTITELTLDKPEFKQLRAKKSSTEQPPLALSLGQILNPASLPFHLIIKQLTIKQGSLHREQEQPWKNLQLKLTDYRNRVVKTKKATRAKTKTLSFSAQQGTRKVAFQGTTTPALELIGKISLQNWNARLFNPYVKTVQLQDGTAHLVMQVNPVQKQYTITELTLDTPKIKVKKENNKSSSVPFPFTVPLGELFNPVSLPFDLVIDRLIIKKGSIEKKQGASWQDLQLDLTAYRNGEKLSAKRKKKAAALSFAEAAALSFTARQGKATVRFQGKVAPDLSLSGKVALRNLHPSLFQPYVGGQHLEFSSEQTVIEGLVHTVQPAGKKKKILIEQAKVVLPHISMQQGQQQGQPLLTAAVTTAEGCVLNLTKSERGRPGLSCTDLTLQQADFSAAAPSFFLAREKTDFLPGFSFDTLKITDSKARLPLQSSEGSGDLNSLTVP